MWLPLYTSPYKPYDICVIKIIHTAGNALISSLGGNCIYLYTCMCMCEALMPMLMSAM